MDGVTTDYTYNNLDQLISAGSVTYDYDDRGNLYQAIDGSQTTTYTYDAADRLTTVNGPSSTVQFAYDADGRRIKQTIGSAITNYLWDEVSAYGDVVLETNDSGATLASYVLGADGIISQSRSGSTSYYLQDGQGSTRALTNSSGAVIDAYSYTAFGELLDQTGSTTNSYLYTGQQFDSLTELYDLRARYYNPALGRFLSQDTYPVNFNNPVELNRYVYTANNPINTIDPSGQFLIDTAWLKRNAIVVGAALVPVGEAAYLYFARTAAIITTYLPPLLSLYSDQIFDLITVGQFGLQLVSNSPLVSGWGGGAGGGGGDDGGNGSWDDLDFPEPGDPNGEGRHNEEVPLGKRIGGIYEFIDQKTGIWYVGKSKDLRDRLHFWIRNGNLSGWDDVVWTEIDSYREKARFVAEGIRLEQFKELGVEVVNVDGHTADKDTIIEWFEEEYYKDPRVVSNWPDWLTNPWPEE